MMCVVKIFKKLLITSVLLAVLCGVQAQNTSAQPKLLLTGIITEGATKKPMVGARVSVVNYSAAITDENGKFSLNVPSWDVDIIVTNDGYETRQIALKG